MAINNKAIKILRGSEENISINEDILEAGQPLYNKNNNYLYIGRGSAINTSIPIQTPRLWGNINDFSSTNNRLGNNQLKENTYEIGPYNASGPSGNTSTLGAGPVLRIAFQNEKSKTASIFLGDDGGENSIISLGANKVEIPWGFLKVNAGISCIDGNIASHKSDQSIVSAGSILSGYVWNVQSNNWERTDGTGNIHAGGDVCVGCNHFLNDYDTPSPRILLRGDTGNIETIGTILAASLTTTGNIEAIGDIKSTNGILSATKIIS